MLIILDGCRIALLAIHFLDGDAVNDTSTRADIQGDAQHLERFCGAFSAAPLCGNLVVGKLGKHC